VTHRTLIAAAAILAAVPAAASANLDAACTTDGVAITLHGFRGTHQVPWTITQDARQVAAGTQTVTAATTFHVPTPGVTGQVLVRATWGPVLPRDTDTAVTITACAPPAPPTDPAPPAPAPQVPVPPVVTIAPPIPASPPPPAVNRRPSCADLMRRNVGRTYLVRLGCVRASSTRRCQIGTFRVVVKGRTYCLASRPRPTRPAVTG